MRTKFVVWVFAALFAMRIGAADDHKTFQVAGMTFAKPEKWAWVDIQPGMRAAQLEVKGNEGQKGEVIFFHFPGGAGGVQANIDRWLGMFQEGKDKINAKTDTVKTAKGTVTFVQAEGTYMSGMPGGPKKPMPGTMLQGAIIEAGEESVFVRLTGPVALVKSAQGDFHKMAESAIQ